jgi:predicted Fe-Mo cluster-binding NifX family protein
MMKLKIAIPLADGKLCMHFGHCGQFAILDVDQSSHKIISRTDLVPPPHAPGVLPAWLHEQGASVVIAGGMGQRAQQIFADHGITVLVGAPVDTPENLAKAYLKGTLECGDNVCDH